MDSTSAGWWITARSKAVCPNTFCKNGLQPAFKRCASTFALPPMTASISGVYRPLLNALMLIVPDKESKYYTQTTFEHIAAWCNAVRPTLSNALRSGFFATIAWRICAFYVWVHAYAKAVSPLSVIGQLIGTSWTYCCTDSTSSFLIAWWSSSVFFFKFLSNWTWFSTII